VHYLVALRKLDISVSLGRVLRYPGQRARKSNLRRKEEEVVREKYEKFGAFWIRTSLFRGIFLNHGREIPLSLRVSILGLQLI
jgi:hypothetical protein